MKDLHSKKQRNFFPEGSPHHPAIGSNGCHQEVSASTAQRNDEHTFQLSRRHKRFPLDVLIADKSQCSITETCNAHSLIFLCKKNISIPLKLEKPTIVKKAHRWNRTPSHTYPLKFILDHAHSRTQTSITTCSYLIYVCNEKSVDQYREEESKMHLKILEENPFEKGNHTVIIPRGPAPF
ncbi:hypothetical protein CEXT_554431 [Caerostris extrusa]|uniref:Uncharacterized protein n=1 Tax=Caerostris extrusa TaxID=172846 RepID=A0AAV4NQ91_CAEEX|nr:hypothetical protein CEXT_554431 [Caerostris extrusa]